MIINVKSVYEIIMTGALDLPIRSIIPSSTFLPHHLEHVNAYIEFTSMVIVVPCGNDVRIGDVYLDLRT